MLTIRKRLRRLVRILSVGAVMLTLLVAGCSTSSAPNSQPPHLAVEGEKPWCESSCPAGYRCSGVKLAGVLTGLCVQGPTQCTSDADCLKVSSTPGTKPIRYVCDKRSGTFPDKSGGVTASDRGTCMPDQSTAFGTQ
jgi:hypothetical protein